ncbi:hypothetical protein MBLNU230_g5123t1 [Neophaeotheca triangularis]
MASVMEYPESPSEEQEAVFPCKGCGDILEEGKAFELAGNRWHIDCFRCNTCGTLLDSDANLLLLGDGSLICNNCTYSCNACGNKIEDLAILTGDQAFCASCFRCRNCKRKIENLRYARTSQGIFCMSCHESLMARRRKKAKTTTKVPSNAGTPSVEKALPSLPPGAAPDSNFMPEMEGPPADAHGAGSGVKSPPERQLKSKRDASSSNLKRDVSPMSDEARRGGFTDALWLKQYNDKIDMSTDGPTLPASTYKDARSSNTSPNAEDDEEQGYLPMAYDPNPAPGPPPGLPARKRVPAPVNPSPPAQQDGRPPRDYFSGRLGAKAASRDRSRDEHRPSSAQSSSTERDPASQAKASPHIAYQEKGRVKKRETSGYNTPASQAQSPSIASQQEKLDRPKPQHLDTGSYTLHRNEGFKLQEVPKSKKASSRSSSRVGGASPVSPDVQSGSDSKKEDSADNQISRSPVSLDSGHSGVNPFDDPKRKEGSNSSAAPMPPARHADRPVRGDSLAASTQKQPASPRRSAPEPPTPANAAMQPPTGHGRNQSTSSIPSLSRDHLTTKGAESSTPVRSSFDAPPPRNSSRTTAPSKSVANGDFIAPRAPPLPPSASNDRHKHSESYGTSHSSNLGGEGRMSPPMRSAGLPKHSADSGLSMEEEMARILRGENNNKRSTREGTEGTGGSGTGGSVMRRVSNAVKHGRSFSDRGLHSSSGKSGHGTNGSLDISSPVTISSPVMSSPSAGEGIEQLRAQLRRAQAKVAELEAEKNVLEDKVNSSSEIKQANSELREKRSTMAFLDTQRDMVVRELEVMTEHLAKAKDNSQPLDLSSLQNSILKDFAESLRKLKDQMGSQIEDLMQKRNELTDEITSLIQMKDKGFSEYEALSNKNAQLLEMNNSLVHSIQDVYKANRGANGTSNSMDVKRDATGNGLGIYHPHAKPDTPTTEVRNLNLVSTDSSLPDLLRETEAEPATVLTTPQVVNIRKGAQAKKFNWRKGGEKVAKNVTKGLKGAFASAPAHEGVQYREREIGLPYNMTQQAIGGSEQSSMMSGSRVGPDGKPNAAGFGFFGQKNGGKQAGNMGAQRNNSSTNLAPAAEASVLFGSELSARCEYENRLIPSIITRCIAEVENRGMLVEGVYRKSGGAGQVKLVQQGFEKDDKFDISDDDLDIHAVTSALKQYFRKLPTPLITYDVYEALLEAGQLGATEGEKKQAMAMRAAVNELPDYHRNCLEYLIQHLARVISHEGQNLMTPGNLAVVFAPTIMRPLSIEREMSDMLAQRTAVQALLDLHETVFGGEE